MLSQALQASLSFQQRDFEWGVGERGVVTLSDDSDSFGFDEDFEDTEIIRFTLPVDDAHQMLDTSSSEQMNSFSNHTPSPYHATPIFPQGNGNGVMEENDGWDSDAEPFHPITMPSTSKALNIVGSLPASQMGGVASI